MAVQILTKIGLQNAWIGEFDRFGFNTVWVEALPTVDKANFLYIAETKNTHFKQLQKNPVWQVLKSVLQLIVPCSSFKLPNLL